MTSDVSYVDQIPSLVPFSIHILSVEFICDLPHVNYWLREAQLLLQVEVVPVPQICLFPPLPFQPGINKARGELLQYVLVKLRFPKDVSSLKTETEPS